MCLQDAEQVDTEAVIGKTSCPLYSELLPHTHMDFGQKHASSDQISLGNSFPLESICEDAVVVDRRQNPLNNFIPAIRSGEWSDIGARSDMEDTHICITDLAKNFGHSEEVISFYGVFDGHEGKGAAQSLLVANAGDCRAVLSRRGMAIEMSKDHRPCCNNERIRIESLGGFIDDGYLNGQLGVTRALGDWHMIGLKEISEKGGPLIAEPEVKLVTLSKEDEFLIIGSDGVWDVFRSQNAVDFARRKLQEHNNVKLCCKQIVEEAIKRGAIDNLTVVMVCFHSEPPPHVVVRRPRFRRSISAEGLQNLKFLGGDEVEVACVAPGDLAHLGELHGAPDEGGRTQVVAVRGGEEVEAVVHGEEEDLAGAGHGVDRGGAAAAVAPGGGGVDPVVVVDGCASSSSSFS
ncbi:hypothetical protein TEA_020248 [Camellia sinensis var. sinensis]|uniref:PPM-type phosphatase domain-containing protein n=1 Tax=Camellia sinensis var. sinensis TaxID=542762 RepID=A0A4S4F1F5_CAMSN|nr:hypothetical protein TEA_020248 [Camellia sinensis var. sinensis]